jgi:DNA-binding MarR family transcriptional regulator
MPTLKDTELRTLLVILRQTAGWNRTGRPVILKYKQLIQKTGRRSEAISSALKSLERRGLIHTIRASRHHPPEFPNKRSAKSEQQQYKDM